jgi:hypothetical protein
MKHPISISISFGNQSWQDCFIPIDQKEGAEVIRKLQGLAIKKLTPLEREEYVPPEEPTAP